MPAEPTASAGRAGTARRTGGVGDEALRERRQAERAGGVTRGPHDGLDRFGYADRKLCDRPPGRNRFIRAVPGPFGTAVS
ncbi:hypothetical protein Plo01_63970 [Planobispora longispora]|uniref:Uncharacterized protein n=1 Tax=Planobispora longispora TaxID=28887 RepID=A0A8J3W8R3_9ACTN|nr:hypothetical protein GCM10020093_017160 [Planobispora longispora]GIH79968.1 hypothetical protein Plo01_63970 [Planobispora longispora]